MRIAILLLVCAIPAHGQEPPSRPPEEPVPAAEEPVRAREEPTREHLAPKGWEESYHRIHYSPVVKVGDLVIVSGIPAAIGSNEEEKIRWAFEQLRVHLETAGASMADVVELASFHVSQNHDEFRAHFDPVLKVHAEYFKSHYPAWTAVGTTGLYSAGAFMEISARAIIGSGKAPRANIPLPPPPPKKK